MSAKKPKRQFVKREVVRQTWSGADALRELKRRAIAQKNNPVNEVFFAEEMAKVWTDGEAREGIQAAIRKRGWKRVAGEWAKKGIYLHSTEGSEADPLAFSWRSVERSMAVLEDSFRSATVEEKRKMNAAFLAGMNYMELLAHDKTAVGVRKKEERFEYIEACERRLVGLGFRVTEKHIRIHCGDLIRDVGVAKLHRDLVEFRRLRKQK